MFMYKMTKEDYDQLLYEATEDKKIQSDIRLTSLLICNRKLNIRYTISPTPLGDIKSYFYFINKRPILTLQVQNRADAFVKLKIHKLICNCQSMEELKSIIKEYGLNSDLPN